MGVALADLPQSPHGLAPQPFSQHDLMAWIMSGGAKLGAEQQPATSCSHLHLDLNALANELNAPSRCGGAEEHVVPEAPGSPASTLENDWRSPAPASPCPEAGAPGTPELHRPAPALAAALGKRKWEDHEAMAIQPRTHRRKALHPMRAAEAVADDWETRCSPARASPPPAARKHDARSRHMPERIHRKLVHVAKAPRPATPAAAGGSNVVKECHDCHTLKTPMWRRVEGLTFCNACGLRRTRALVGR